VGIDERIPQLQQIEAATGLVRNAHDRVSNLSVPGARQAKQVSSTFVNSAGPARSEDVYVLSRKGAIVDVVAVTSSRAGPIVDPAAVVDSLRLAGE